MSTPLTHDEVLALPSEKRGPWVENLRVYYPRWHQLWRRIEFCHTQQPIAAEPPCLMLVGPQGAGKSTLIDSYLAQHPRTVTAETIIQPVLKTPVATPATVKNVATALLHVLGDPRHDKGTTAAMTIRLHTFFRDCGVRLLILDELQHFVDNESEKVLKNASNWLKALIKDTRVACVLVGTQGDAERVVDSNPQLGRLFGDPVILAPFSWDDRRPETVNEFKQLLREIEKRLPLREPSRLDREEMAWRLYVASEGHISYLMAVVRLATHKALEQRREALDLPLLWLAFEERGAGIRRNITNPFGEEPPPVRRR